MLEPVFPEQTQVTKNCDSYKIGLAIFSYNRPQFLDDIYQRILLLQLTNRYCFHLFNDGPKTIETREIKEVHNLTDSFSRSISNFVITRRFENLGLADSIHFGLDSVFKNHSKAIVLEDDIIPTRQFFETMDFYLEHFEFNPEIGSITGANTTNFHPLERRDFLASRRHSSWGWATWADRWLSIDWDWVKNEFLKDESLVKKVKKVSPDLVQYAKAQEDGKIDSWATAMNIDFIKRNLMCIVPRRSLIKNIGFDGSGTHSTNQNYQKKADGFILKENSELELLYDFEESSIYNFLVMKENSLLRDFPKGSVLRLLLKIRFLLIRS
jgi:hypothetical protein